MKFKETLRNAPMQKKFKKVVNTIVGMFIVAIIISYIGATIVKNNFQKFYEEIYVNAEAGFRMQEEVQEFGKDVLWAATVADHNLMAEYATKATEMAAVIQENAALLQGTFQSGELLNRFNEAFTAYNSAEEKLLELLKGNQQAEVLKVYNSDYAPVAENLNVILEEMNNVTDIEAEDTFMTAQYTALVVFILVILLIIVCTYISILLSRRLTCIITEPISELEEAAAKLTVGDLDIEINYVGEDELGHLADAYRNTCANLKLIIDDMKYIMEELKDGNFRVKSKCIDSYVGDFKEIIFNLKEMVYKQSDVLKQINEASGQVASGANHMAESAQGLAEGATEQAVSVEKLTATIDSVAISVQESAKASEKAYRDASSYQEEAERGHKEMAELIEAMDRISKASKEIEDIIGEIEDIASQTNLLSLNASIEAARAGEAGRGFAVVAEQIGKLANDSAESAVKTRELIKNALQEIEGGNEITNRTREALEKVIAGIQFLSETVKESSEASVSHAQQMKEVEIGAEQITDVVQSNSAAAEETSATSEELSAQAATLNDLTSQFKLV